MSSPVTPQYFEAMAPVELGDELPAALVAAGYCWGVLCRSAAWSPHLAESLRRAHRGGRDNLAALRVCGAGSHHAGPGAPGRSPWAILL